MYLFRYHGKTCLHSGKKKKQKTDGKMYVYLPWYYCFVSIIINIIINLNILDIGVFSPAGNQHQVTIFF